MKRIIRAFLGALVMLGAATLPAFATDLNPSGHTGSATGTSTQSSFPAVIPEEKSYGNFRCPNMLIIGGDQNVNAKNSFGQNKWLNIPSIVLRPAAKRPGDALDTIIKWTTPSAARVYTIPDAGATANLVLDQGNYTIGGTWTFSNPPTVTGGITSANIQTGSAKRQLVKVLLSPVTAAAADSTTYAGLAFFGRAGIVKRISLACHVAPTVGTDTIEVLKNNTTTMLSAATFDANTLVADVVTNATLTATGADLALTATDTIRCKYNAGSQTTDAQDVEAVIEFEPTDF